MTTTERFHKNKLPREQQNCKHKTKSKADVKFFHSANVYFPPPIHYVPSRSKYTRHERVL